MIFKFNSPFVYRFTVNQHKRIKGNLYQKIHNAYQQNKNNKTFKWSLESHSRVVTSYHSSDSNSFTSFFDDYFQNNVIWNPLDSLYSELNYSAINSNLLHIWWNYYNIGDYAEIHDHKGESFISGVYLLHLTEKNKTIFLYNTEIEDQKHTTEYAEEGDVLLFPSNLYHYVLPAEAERITISFNIKTKFMGM